MQNVNNKRKEEGKMKQEKGRVKYEVLNNKKSVEK